LFKFLNAQRPATFSANLFHAGQVRLSVLQPKHLPLAAHHPSSFGFRSGSLRTRAKELVRHGNQQITMVDGKPTIQI